ncbi:MAG: hypothetical protein N2319_02505 [Candidatus Kapabacteria bacterium]|nr:hypothetical protein [Candidatus Kapabacteria bacterium]
MLRELFKKLATALKKHKIPYIIIGGQAALIYEEPRFTNDIDVTLGIGIEKINEILNLCKEISLRILIENPEGSFQRLWFYLPMMSSVK